MKSNLIKDTTKEERIAQTKPAYNLQIATENQYMIKIPQMGTSERIALIKAWIPDDDGLQDCDMDLWDIYADYINGKREIAEINAQMTGTFYTEEDLNH